MVSSARISRFSSQEEDLLLRNTKKVKEPSDLIKMDNKAYKESLLTPIGGVVFAEKSNMDMVMENVQETRIVPHGEGSSKINAKGPIIPVSDEELSQWPSQWKNPLIVNSLGKKVSFRMIENKLQRSWTKNGTIQIIDMHDGYYQVVFNNEEDYKHALFEGPWMVGDHYLIVYR